MNEFRKMAATPALNSVVRGRARISVLEPRLIRLEWCEEGIFEDRPTQNICCRDLGEWQFSVRDEGDMLSIDTGRCGSYSATTEDAFRRIISRSPLK